MTGLEERGYRPKPKERDLIAAYLWPRFDRAMRERVSIEMIHGNSWSGWLENGNPHGDPRPGPVAKPRGIMALSQQWEINENKVLREWSDMLPVYDPELFCRITGV